LSCDASSYGIGVVISHILPNNEERPIAYTSRTLNLAEQRYSQIDKEALAIVFCIKKFHQYLCGRHFILFTDQKHELTVEQNCIFLGHRLVVPKCLQEIFLNE